MSRKLLVALMVVTFSLCGGSPGLSALDWCSSGICQEWVARYDGGPGGWNSADAVALDGWGSVYVTGTSYSPATGDDFATAKYSADGSEQWVARYNSSSTLSDAARALAVDAAGNVYVTGEAAGGKDYATVKYRPDGSQDWVARYGGPYGTYNEPWALAVDGLGNVYVTGESPSGQPYYYKDYATIKYGPDGSELWVARYDGSGSNPAHEDVARAVAVDESGNVYVTGESYGSGTGYDYATVKYGPDGNELWVAGYNGSSDLARALAVDASGNVYVTGSSCLDSVACDYVTIKYRPDGTEDWVAYYNGPAPSTDRAVDLALDDAGNVYVTGSSYAYGSSDDYATVKYGPDGSEQWVARYNEPDSRNDRANAVALDGAGNVYVTGSSESWIAADYATIKYAPDGSEQWVARYNGPGNSSDIATAVAVDPWGRVYVTGRSTGSDGYLDYATIKYSPDADRDSDGCYDSEEMLGALSPKPGSTGAYDPLAWHDFYDVPMPASPDMIPNGSKNQAVSISDVLAVLFYVGTADDGDPNVSGVDYDSDKDGDTVEDGQDYDRSPSALPNPPWEAGPPDGAVTMEDVLATLAQVGLSCAGPP